MSGASLIAPGRPVGRISADGLVLTASGDASVRWTEGERLHHLFEARCDALARDGEGDRLAVDGPDATLTYVELDHRANRLAHHLARTGRVTPGDRVGLLFDTPVDGYVAMLAVLKLHAAYVPLDVAFPPERLAFIVGDAGAETVLTISRLAPGLRRRNNAGVVCLDVAADAIAAESCERPTGLRVADELAYVIYTSGTTGRPKGVAIAHSSICNFVRVAAGAYGMRADDRVYQGLTIAFDFAIEEIWIAWMAGATLVPRPAGAALLGSDLHAFLLDRHVTALVCVPTLLATLDADLPELRFLLVSGEACPPDLAARWQRPGRRMLNVYGPTETTVSATWSTLEPGRPVTIGVPLPTYSIVILDPDADRALPLHEEGEIAIAGIGLADGYLGLPERTARSFVPDFLALPDNPSGRLYRTGDLGAVNADGQLEHRGRIDEQIKLRGYRIELGEIEVLLRCMPSIGQAVVRTWERAPGAIELVGYYTSARSGEGDIEGDIDETAILDHLRTHLPPYMVPAQLERLASIPTMPSGKVDRRLLPAPRARGRPAAPIDAQAAPRPGLETALAAALAVALELDQPSATADFFADLGGDSLTMAMFCARLHDQPDVRTVSMRDVYAHSTVRELARALADPRRTASEGPVGRPAGTRLVAPVGRPRVALCAALQALAFLLYAGAAAAAFDLGAGWLTAAHGALALYARAVAVGTGTLLVAGLVPILAKWTLIGRFTERPIRLWSVAYVRFWIVKTLLVANPTVRLIVGTPLYGSYLRALGARIGRGTTILTTHMPVAADLIRIGDGCLVRKDGRLNGYRARAGAIEFGPVSLGRDCVVSEHVMFDIATSIGDGAQIGHASALHAGQHVPAGERWHGSPARPAPAGADFVRVPPLTLRARRRYLYGAARLLLTLAAVSPLEAVVATVLVGHVSWLRGLPVSGILALAAIVTLTVPLVAALVAATVPRLLTRSLRPGRVYPLYGAHWAILRIVVRTSNIPLLTTLCGDSSLIVSYLRVLGYRLGAVRQTGSNFGLQVKHDVPALCTVSSGTMVSDGLSLANAEISSTSFCVSPATIGADNFLGNAIVFPAGARVGDNCLLGTKVMVPLDGPLRENTGLLGSPCFEIPRSVRRDADMNALAGSPPLAAKLRHNLVTIALFAAVRFVVIAALLASAAIDDRAPGLAAWPASLATILLDVAMPLAVFVAAERLLIARRDRPPAICSIYDRAFWRHERFWKVPAPGYLRILDGTPLKGVAWRTLGARVGRRLFDDGCSMTERRLVSIGDDCVLNTGTSLQSHSLEDGAFKSGPIVVGDEVCLGTGAFAHYDVVIGDGAVLETDAFLMKGTRVAAATAWAGNPALETAACAAHPPGDD
ncbi:MAG: amino acid adenylation domain-containing protein [Solirubrobacterales bacterium]|nr:amino acid adenylation domain-containing protein [Solirubrobacterales bacterium]